MLVNSRCNQCQQGQCGRCPAEILVGKGFIRNAGDHCACANEGHHKPQSKKEPPKIKSMLGRRTVEDEPAITRKVESNTDDDYIEVD